MGGAVQEALDDQRKRLECDIYELIVDGRTWWQSIDDHLITPLPEELDSMPFASREHLPRYCEEAVVKLVRVFDTTITVDPRSFASRIKKLKQGRGGYRRARKSNS